MQNRAIFRKFERNNISDDVIPNLAVELLEERVTFMRSESQGKFCSLSGINGPLRTLARCSHPNGPRFSHALTAQ